MDSFRRTSCAGRSVALLEALSSVSAENLVVVDASAALAAVEVLLVNGIAKTLNGEEGYGGHLVVVHGYEGGLS